MIILEIMTKMMMMILTIMKIMLMMIIMTIVKIVLKTMRKKMFTLQRSVISLYSKSLYLFQGKILSEGTHSELSQSGVDFSQLLTISEPETSQVKELRRSSLSKQDGGRPTELHGYRYKRADSIISADGVGHSYVVQRVFLLLNVLGSSCFLACF